MISDHFFLFCDRFIIGPHLITVSPMSRLSCKKCDEIEKLFFGRWCVLAMMMKKNKSKRRSTDSESIYTFPESSADDQPTLSAKT